MATWQARDWPGNVRELRNFADRWVLRLEIPEASHTEHPAQASLAVHVDAFERSLIEAELRRVQGSVVRAAQALGLPRKTLYDKLKRHSLDPDAYRAGSSPAG